MSRKTIKKTFTLSGIGLHTGKHSTLTIKPMIDEHRGIVFVKEGIEIKADVKNVITTNRSTTLGKENLQIKTTEHLLAAIYALEIDDLYIEIDGEEIPILNGSAEPFCSALKDAEIIEKEGERDYFEVDKILQFKLEETGSEFVLIPSDYFEARALIDFKSPIVNKQFAEILDLRTFCDDFAPSRTFGFFSEVEDLLDQGLIKGGNLDNAIVIADKVLSDKDIDRFAKKLNIEKINIEQEGIISTIPLKYPNEPARHKLLDFIGDISLLGMPVKGRIIAKKPGHKANIEFTKFLRQKSIKLRKLKGKPKYDPTEKPVIDTKEIMKLLPHRYPFLLVDKIMEIGDDYIVGIKNLTFNELLFQGHFPGNPIFPGVLQMEALAQTGGILALKLQNNPTGWDTYFLKMNNVKFKNMAVPGDTLIMKMQLVEPIRRGIVHMKGIIYVGDKIISEGDLVAQIVKQ